MELVPPTTISPIQGLTFLAGLAEARNRNQAALQRLELQLAEKDQIARLNSASQQSKLDMMSKNYDSLDAYRKIEGATSEARAANLASKADKAQEHAQDVVDAQNSINNIDAEPGTPEWRTKYNIAWSQFPRLKSTPDGKRMWQEGLDNHRTAAGETKEAHFRTIEDFRKNVHLTTGSEYFDPTHWGDAKESGYKYRILSPNGILPPNTSKEDIAKIPGVSYQRISSKDFDLLNQQRKNVDDLFSSPVLSKSADTQVSTPKKIRVKSPDGTVGLIPDSQLDQALQEGYEQIQ